MTVSDKLTQIAQDMPKVFEAGEKSEYDNFWDTFQDFGNRTDYQGGFYGRGWTEKNFKPKYDIKPTGRMTNMFYLSLINADLVQLCEEQGITFDISGVTRYGYAFSYCKFTHLGVLDLSQTDVQSTYIFNNSPSIHTIDKIIVSENTATYAYWFDNCTGLKEIRFEGVIDKSIDLHWSTGLSMASLASIVSCLSDSATEQTITLPTTAEAIYDESTYVGKWAELVAEHPNWQFLYA